MRHFRRKIKKYNNFWLKIDKILLLLFVLELVFPQYSLANSYSDQNITNLNNGQLEEINSILQVRLPKNEERQPRYRVNLIATAYNSLSSQTDGNPCKTASGFNLCEHGKEDIIATNFLPFGTLVKIPELYGDKIFRVKDRMNPKYYRHIDLWFKDYDEAKKFGWRYVEIEVY